MYLNRIWRGRQISIKNLQTLMEGGTEVNVQIEIKVMVKLICMDKKQGGGGGGEEQVDRHTDKDLETKKR